MDYELFGLLKDIPAEATAQERLFCEEYLANGRDARAAAIAAGVGEALAEKRGKDWLRMPRIRKALNDQRIEAQASDRRRQLEQSVMTELGSIAFSDIRALYDPLTGEMLPIHLWSPSAAAAVKSVRFETVKNEETGEVKTLLKEVQFYDKTRALQQIMLQTGMMKAAEQMPDGLAARLERALAAAQG